MYGLPLLEHWSINDAMKTSWHNGLRDVTHLKVLAQ
ncbi:MAG: hypothetical protein ACI95X_002563 [Paraglaciecola sp.]